MKPRLFLPAVVSGLLLWAAFFPLDLGLLAYVALVPWLSLVRAENVSNRRRYFAAYVGGLAFFLPALQWIRVAHPAMYGAWVGLALYCSLYFPAALFLLRRLDRLGRPPLAFTLPVVWVALEYFRAHFATGFPFLAHLGLYQLIGFGWYFLGYTQHAFAPVIQMADLGGVYLVTALVAAVNGTVFEWLIRVPAVRRLLRWPPEHTAGFYREMWTATAAAAALLGAVLYGASVLQHPEPTRGPRVAAVQDSIPQDAKMADAASLFAKHDHLTRTAMARADLVVWPETCYPYALYAVAPGTTDVPAAFAKNVANSRRGLAADAAAWTAPVLLGLNANEWENGNAWKYNSAALVVPGDGVTDRYDKMHLVPFGEYVPLRETFPWLRWFTPYRHDYSCRPGDRYTRFRLTVADKVYTFGVLICYEDSDPYLARQYAVSSGAEDPVDFLVNISNDGWFRGWEEHEQHLAICRFRAVEARRPVVRAVNMGVSAIIDADGRIQALPGNSVRGSVGMRGTVTDRLKLDSRTSLYARVGDWLPAMCWAAIGAGLVAGRGRRAKHG